MVDTGTLADLQKEIIECYTVDHFQRNWPRPYSGHGRLRHILVIVGPSSVVRASRLSVAQVHAAGHGVHRHGTAMAGTVHGR